MHCNYYEKFWEKINSNKNKHVGEPWLSKLKDGTKKIEGRAGKKQHYIPLIGSEIRLYNKNNEVKLKLLDVRWYPDLRTYLNAEGFENVLPDESIKTYQDALDEYHRFYSDEVVEEKGGICALQF